MSKESIKFEKQGSVGTITLNRPHIMNAVNFDVLGGFEAILNGLEKDEEIRVVVLQGAGGNFSSGADLYFLNTVNYAPDALKLLQRLRKIILKLRELPQPVISKVRGVAYGVGMNLTLASDFVIASHDARFCEVFVDIGVVMDGGGTYFLPRLVGQVKAREIALLGDELDGKTAADIGLIYKSVPDEALDREVDHLVRRLCEKPPLPLSLLKKGLEESLDMTLGQALEWEAAHQAVMLQSREHKDVIQQFVNTKGETAE